MYKLFLDDVRQPHTTSNVWRDGEWVEFRSVAHWEIVRTYNDFVKIITEKGLPKIVSFDHDLSWEHYPFFHDDPSAEIDYSKYKEKTGYDCAKWLIEYCEDKKLELPEWQVHSFNTVGRENIIKLLEGYERHKRNSKND